jgi:hypothetical protein
LSILSQKYQAFPAVVAFNQKARATNFPFLVLVTQINSITVYIFFWTLYVLYVKTSLLWSRPNNLSLVCLYLSYISFLLFGHFFYFLFFWHTDRKHYYIKVVESIQFVCAGNSGISRVLCNANTYWSIHEGLFFNSSPALDLKYPLRLPYIHFYFSSLHLQYKINSIHS